MATKPTRKRNKALAKALAKALRATPGGKRAVAEHFGIRQQSVNTWIKNGYAPPERCVGLEKLSRGAVTRYELQPDTFGSAPPGELKKAS